MDITRIKEDANGNGRMVVHFTAFETINYGFAVFLANMIGGKRYHTINYGGGIVFQSYSKKELELKIKEFVENARKALLRDKVGYTETDARIICKYDGRTKRRLKDGWKMFFDGNFVEFLPKLK
jgi:hypothetical protein